MMESWNCGRITLHVSIKTMHTFQLLTLDYGRHVMPTMNALIRMPCAGLVIVAAALLFMTTWEDVVCCNIQRNIQFSFL